MIGRSYQKDSFSRLLNSSKSEFVVVYGRRRVGKTYMIKHILKDHMDFHMTGIDDASLEEQLDNFHKKLKIFSNGKPSTVPTSWSQAFDQLKTYLSKKRKRSKKVIFLDELPWMASSKSNFLNMLGHFWNDWAVDNHVLLVVCGSAASWMVDNVINNKGGLHNRVTHYMPLRPFTLGETALFLSSKNIVASQYQVIQLYMVFGGIPFYLEQLIPGKSIPQNIDRICFDKDGALRDEFDRVYTSLFSKAANHIAVVKALGSKWKGLTRNEIVHISGLANGGSLTRTLVELEKSTFISTFLPFDKKKKGTIYRLTDNFSLFYLKFMSERSLQVDKGTFLQLFNQPSYRVWSGYAFENVCMLHRPQIAKALGVDRIAHQFSSYLAKGRKDERGMQIDMLIDRADGVINLCEIKFSNAMFKLSPDYKLKLQQRAVDFSHRTRSKKAIFTTMITTYGLDNPMLHTEAIQNEIGMEALFE